LTRRAFPLVAQRPSRAAQTTTPASGESAAPSLLALLPPPEGDLPAPEFPVQLINIAAALAPHDLQPMTAGDDPATHVDALADAPVAYWARHEMWTAPDAWRERLGFNPFAVHALANYGPAEDYVLLVQANIDADQVRQAWDATGYVPIGGTPEIMHLDVDDAARTDYMLDGLIGLFSGSYDYAAMLPDGIMAFASSQERVEQMVALADGDSGSILDHRAVAACTALLPRETTLAWHLNGARFRADPVDAPLVLPPAGTNLTQEQHDKITAGVTADEELLREIEAEHGPMPALELVTLAATPTQHLLMVCPLDPAATDTALEIVLRRFEQMNSRSTTAPYTELFRITGTTVSDNGVGIMTLDAIGNATLFRLLDAGDLRFLNVG
jgi:hypothetical protein